MNPVVKTSIGGSGGFPIGGDGIRGLPINGLEKSEVCPKERLHLGVRINMFWPLFSQTLLKGV